ncbi:MAG: hypothetical protein R3B52_01685 [Candidatus Paceibacterota bacterium]
MSTRRIFDLAGANAAIPLLAVLMRLLFQEHAHFCALDRDADRFPDDWQLKQAAEDSLEKVVALEKELYSLLPDSRVDYEQDVLLLKYPMTFVGVYGCHAWYPGQKAFSPWEQLPYSTTTSFS